MSGLATQPIGDFLAGMASTSPAPGAGSAGALALAIGIACARKALAMTLRHRPDDQRIADLCKRFSSLSEQAMAGAAADESSFGAYIGALRQPHDAPGRHEAERRALEDLIAIGENMIALADEVHGLILGFKAEIIPAMANDIGAALALVSAARSIEADCTAESVRSLKADSK
jgi:formiminotetrahydrofolate cyclodeaminase